MEYKFYCDQEEIGKMNLIVNLNKVVADIKRGEKAINSLGNDITVLENDLNQIELIKKNDTKNIEKQVKLKGLKRNLKDYLKAVSKLELKYSKISNELETNFNLKNDITFFRFGINLFEHVRNFKVVQIK